MAEFSHELLTAHHEEAARAFVPLVSLLAKVLAEAVEAGIVRAGVENEEAAGTILATIMFNAAYAATISGTEPDEPARAAELMWELISGGILSDSHA